MKTHLGPLRLMILAILSLLVGIMASNSFAAEASKTSTNAPAKAAKRFAPDDPHDRGLRLAGKDEVGIRLRDIIGVDNIMWGSDYPHSESTFPQSRQILAQILAGVPEDECAKIVGGTTARLYHFDLVRLA